MCEGTKISETGAIGASSSHHYAYLPLAGGWQLIVTNNHWDLRWHTYISSGGRKRSRVCLIVKVCLGLT